MPVTGLHHARFQVADLAAVEAFGNDFGLVTAERSHDRLYMRTQGGDAYAYVAERGEANRFLGFAFEAESADDLDRLVAAHSASAPRDLDGPGGGRAVTLTDPNGFAVDVVHGAVRTDPGAAGPDLAHNNPVTRRRVGEMQHKHTLGPARLNRLGHIGIFIRDFAETAAWYEQMFGMVGSDVYHVPHDPSHKIVGFFRLNRGNEWVDHHTLALMQRDTPDCHHVSFEAQDYEAQFVAHRWLASRGHEPVWGVGRHPHGSHIFDVWRDAGGWRFETFSDTDLLNESAGTKIHNIAHVQMDVWSSDPPDRYFA